MLRATVALALLVPHLASLASRLQRSQDADSNSGTDSMVGEVQAAMVMSSMLPQHGPGPTKEVAQKMRDAGDIFHSGWELLQTAQQSLNGVKEQLYAKMHLQSVAQDLATAEECLLKGGKKLLTARKMQSEAQDALQSSQTNVLGPPPEEPKSWSEVDRMNHLTRKSENELKANMRYLKQMAQRNGISLISVASEKVIKVDDDSGDASILAFMAKMD
eukprot:gnl/MRDRNA2_/MRDRNA2_92092_c0_seq1.p1 gnl/MRDRNA2_/MRDRNA2_92092_c0~~gnl/MRDRNA2_/MRDRNA2_92092_c0_seq1.p1  ORF type:complete len:217 (+),score=61.34 gnl/MRDRNA2_/MRDRNA2_92092_c0_seq1:79-729(+)